MTLNESITDIRLHLNQPDQNDPNPRIVLLKLKDATQLMHLEMQNTSIAWDVDSTQIVTIVGKPDYPIDVPPDQFGKDFRVVTLDPTDRYFVSREIRRCDMNDNDNFYRGAEQSPASGHTAVLANFYRKGNQIFMRLVPAPGEGGKIYEVWYETSSTGMDSLSDSPTIAPFQRFRNIRASMALIPYCRWSGMDATMMAAQGQAIGTALFGQAAEHKKAWDDWISSDREDGTTIRVSYGGDSDIWY